MDPILAQLLGFGFGAIPKAFGELFGGAEEAEARRARAAAATQFDDDMLSPIDQDLAGFLRDYQLDNSAVSGLEGDAGSIAQQKEMLAQLRQMLAQGGRDGQYLQDVQGASDAVAGQLQSAGAEVNRNMAGGMSPAQAAALAQNQNMNAALSGNRMAMGAAAGASNREMDAIRAYGSMLDNMRRTDFAERETAAQGADALSRFNAGARRNARNDRLQAQMDAFNQRLQLARGRSGAYTGQANAADEYANRARSSGDAWGNRFGAVGADILGEAERRGQAGQGGAGSQYAEWSKNWDDEFRKRFG